MADPAQRERTKLTDRWIDTATRPDLYPPPVQMEGDSTPSLAEMSGAAASGTATDDTWTHLIGEASAPVGEFARVKVPRGLRLRRAPHADAETTAVMPFDTLIRVERKTAHGWAYAIALGDAHDADAVTGEGFCELDFLMVAPPEPAAHLHYVQGEMPKDIAARYYKGGGFDRGADARLFVEAIWQANEGRTSGVYRKDAELSRRDTILRGEDAEETIRVWKSIGVRDGHAIWIPSRAFVTQLASQGAITSGSISDEAWQAAASAGSELMDWAKYGAGFVVGTLKGAYGSVRDLVMGVVDLAETIYDIVKAIIEEGFIDACESFGKKIANFFENAPETLKSLGTWFADQWTAEDGWQRGLFQGEVIGYVAMMLVITILTLGGGAAAQAGGKFGQVVKLVRTLDAAGDISAYAGRLTRVVRVPDGVKDALRGRPASSGARAPDKPDVTTTPESIVTPEIPSAPSAVRYDDVPHSPQGKIPGRLKSHLDAQGNLRPADPDGHATPVQHIRGSEPMKSKSPYTSFSEGAGTGKSYGQQKLEIDLKQLRHDIEKGEIKDVEIVEHDELVMHLQQAIENANLRYTENPSPKNLERLERARADLTNATRDREILVKGIVPAKYIESQPVTPKPKQP